MSAVDRRLRRRGLRPLGRPAGSARRRGRRCSTGWPGTTRCGPASGPGRSSARCPGSRGGVGGRTTVGGRARTATTTPSGRPWPSRAGWRSSCPRTRAASAWAWSRSPCCARRSGAAWWPPRSCPRSWRSARCAAPRRGPTPRPRSGARRWARATAVGCVAAVAGRRPAHGRRAGRRRRRARAARTPPVGLRALGRRRRGRSPTAASTRSTCAPHGRPTPLPAMDRTRELGRAAPSTARRHGASAAPRRPALLLDRAATLASAEMLGAADRVLAMTVAVRQGPGAVRQAHRLVPGRQAHAGRRAGRRGGDALDGVLRRLVRAPPATAERSLSASMAKAWCSDASRRVMATGLQVHGGIGFTWEHDMHLYLKRAQLDQVSYGDAAVPPRPHRRRCCAPGLEAGADACPDRASSRRLRRRSSAQCAHAACRRSRACASGLRSRHRAWPPAGRSASCLRAARRR